jgi:hypothetical protein
MWKAVKGKGISTLRKAGIDVQFGTLEKQCKTLNEAFCKYILRKEPFVILKVGQKPTDKLKQDLKYHVRMTLGPIAQPEDIELLTRELNLKETTPTVLDALVSAYGREAWYAAFRRMETGQSSKLRMARRSASHCQTPRTMIRW